MPKKTSSALSHSASEEKRRGPKWTVNPDAVRGRADNWRTVFELVWSRLWPPLEQANTEGDVRAALELAAPYRDYFANHAGLILKTIKEQGFPKTQRGRINFLSDSIAGLGTVSPRRSRDICAANRAAAKKKGQILRWEYYIECSCGYKGQSLDHACPLCEAPIVFPVTPGMF